MSRTFLTLPLPYRITLAAMLLLFVGSLAMLVLAARAVAPVAAVEMQKNTLAVGRALSTQFALAIAAGIPVDRLNGVGELLAEVLEDNPTLRGIELLTADGRRLIQAGAALPSQDTTGSNWQGGAVTSSPVQVGQQIVGTVRVGGDARFVEQEILVLLGAIAALFAAGLLAMAELTRLICRRGIDEPAAQLRSAFQQVLAGQLPAPEVLAGTAAFAQAARRFQQVLRHVQDRFDQVAAAARAIRGLDLDAVSGARLSELLEQVNGGLRPLRDAISGPTAAAPYWLLFFALVLAEMPRAIMPVLMLEQGGGPWRDLLPVLPVLAWAGGGLIGYGLTLRWNSRPNQYLLAGCGMLAAGFMAMLLLPGLAGPILARFLAGAGIGAIWRAIRGSASVSPVRLASLLIGGDLVGPVLGGVVAESLGRSWVAILALCGVLSFAAWGNRMLLSATGTRRGTEPPVMVWRSSGFAAGILSGALLHLWIPAHMLAVEDHGSAMTAYAVIGMAILVGGRCNLPILAGWLCAISGAGLLVLDFDAVWPSYAALPLLGLGLGCLYRDGDECAASWLPGWATGMLVGAGLVALVGVMPPLESKMLVVPVVIGLVATWSAIRHRSPV